MSEPLIQHVVFVTSLTSEVLKLPGFELNGETTEKRAGSVLHTVDQDQYWVSISRTNNEKGLKSHVSGSLGC